MNRFPVGPERSRLVGGRSGHASGRSPLGLCSLAAALSAALTLLILRPPEASGGEVRRSESAEGRLRAGEIQEAARKIEAARRGVRARDDPFEALAEELRETRAVLRAIAAPTANPTAADPLASLEQHAAQLRRRCDELLPVAEQRASLAGIVSQLEDRCARLLAAIDEIRALPDSQSRSERALALLGELAAAGPRGRDPRRAPPEPTLRGVE